MKREIKIFFTAVMFFTRIPCPSFTDHNPDYLNKSAKYFTLVGLLLGALCGFSFFLAALVFSKVIALLLSLVVSLLLTGAFHEDGMADVCDGFGGGWTKLKILDIMKDSRVGTFGLVGLSLTLATKFAALNELPTNLIVIILISGHAISRLTSVTLIYTEEYAREDLLSKAKPLATKLSTNNYLVAVFFGIAPLLLFQNYWVFLTIVPLIVVKVYLTSYFNKWIGGYTGDCLGAVQQIAEVVFYLSLILLFKFLV
jgi:adenosylcobinamide-GDP ribazoletransferase